MRRTAGELADQEKLPYPPGQSQLNRRRSVRLRETAGRACTATSQRLLHTGHHCTGLI